MKQKGFTLVSLLVALAILGILFTYTTLSTSGFLDGLRLKSAVKDAASALRSAQARAVAEKRTIRVSFISDSYLIDGKICNLPGKIRAHKDKEFRFSASGAPLVGYSGTLILTNGKQIKKIIISSAGRIRIE
jgi:prepilin-type N-terminal cleavage/methylation domain-containing protein